MSVHSVNQELIENLQVFKGFVFPVAELLLPWLEGNARHFPEGGRHLTIWIHHDIDFRCYTISHVLFCEYLLGTPMFMPSLYISVSAIILFIAAQASGMSAKGTNSVRIKFLGWLCVTTATYRPPSESYNVRATLHLYILYSLTLNRM